MALYSRAQISKQTFTKNNYLYKIKFKFHLRRIIKQKLHIIFRKRPHLETSSVPIKRRFRGPNKFKIDLDQPTGEQQQQRTSTIATLTQKINNHGRGRLPIESKQHHNPFINID